VAKFIFTKNYENALSRVEDYIYSAKNSLEVVESFLDEHDNALKFIGENPKTPAIHPVTGDQSWNFADGRYRLFFRCADVQGETRVYLLHLIDNKEVNLDVYPNNKIPTYDED
jgi:gamma-glutamylcysteine synthetase